MTIMNFFRLKTYFNGVFLTFSAHFDEYFGDFSSTSVQYLYDTESSKT